MEDKNFQERYHRQLILKEFGLAAQEALLHARVLVIGAGGLGCPVLQYLAAAGTGCIGIVDDDLVSLSNLHRQVLYDTNDLGKSKVAVAAARLRLMNPGICIKDDHTRLDQGNCLSLVRGYDIIVDCTDNFASRYMINDAAVLNNKPVVYGAVNRFEGQVAVFNGMIKTGERSANYRDLFPDQPQPGEVLNCEEAGVLGVLPGMIGTMQANEVIKLITGVGEPLLNLLLTYSSLTNKVSLFEYKRIISSQSLLPRNEEDFMKMNYEMACNNDDLHFGIDEERFESMLMETTARIIDVREDHELPSVTEFRHERIPLGRLDQRMKELAEGPVVFFCQSGIRSQQAAARAAEYFGDKARFFSLQGGIIGWKKLRDKQPV